jgi:hypothetical protein
MIIIWLNEIDEKSLDEFFSLISRWDELIFVLEHEKEFYLFKTKEKDGEERNFKKIHKNKKLKDNLVIKLISKRVKGGLVYTKLRMKKKENLIKRFKDTHTILFLYHE